MEEAIHPFHFGAKGKTEIKMNVVQKRQIDKNQNDWATALRATRTHTQRYTRAQGKRLKQSIDIYAF